MGSKKPCPGCGRVDPERAANSVCHQCKCDLELSKAYKVELEQRKKKNTSDVEWIRIPDHWSGLPRFCDDKLKEAIYNLILKLGKPLDKSNIRMIYEAEHPHKQYSGHYTNQYDQYVCVPVGVRAALGELFEQIRLSLASTYASGKKYGRSILHRLADGDISVKDFYL